MGPSEIKNERSSNLESKKLDNKVTLFEDPCFIAMNIYVPNVAYLDTILKRYQHKFSRF